jgi:hypothetical protein
MIVQIAIATGTAPSAWWTEDDATLATVIDELEDAAERARR